MLITSGARYMLSPMSLTKSQPTLSWAVLPSQPVDRLDKPRCIRPPSSKFHGRLQHEQPGRIGEVAGGGDRLSLLEYVRNRAVVQYILGDQ